MKFLNISLLFIALFVININAQIYRSPAYVRFIANGYINQSPYFNTLEYALNNVKSLASVTQPYVFWIAGDTIRIADWDSVFTESGLTMKDSIDIYYVATGKIKWAGFGFGGGGGNSIIISQDDTTFHYGWPTWDNENVALPIWQRELGRAFDEADEEVWRLIVYTKNPLYIENDTLKIDTTGFGGGVVEIDIDTLTFVRTTGNQTISGMKTFSGTLRMTATLDFSGSGSIQLPGTNTGGISSPRRIWGVGDNIYYTKSGTDTGKVALIDNVTKKLDCDTCIQLKNMSYEVINEIDSKMPWDVAHVYLDESAYTPEVTQNVYLKLTPTFTQVEVSHMTVGGDTITVVTSYTGDFWMLVSFTLQNAATDDFTLQVRKNNSVVHSARFTGAGGSEYIAVSVQHYFPSLVVGDDISLYITNTANNNNPVMTEMNIYVTQVHP